MALSRLHRFSAFALLGAALGGCCANDVCDPDDPLADAVKLRFSPRFAQNDLDTLTVLRYPKVFTANTRPESVTFVRTAAPLRGDSILINNSTPFARTGNTTLGNYRYVVQYLAHPNGVPKGVLTTAFVIDSLRIQGNYEATGCCTQYTNTTKTVYYTSGGVAQVVDLKQQPFLLIP
ncbi:hypothetical protein [Hymenobacter properus]|uniref:Lipoprotein n=1 Tax=Hymenobacter properus TaxID=2791026 RepID=A0A931BE92_9BACT|nr:hypothetical protein [Hymenobacter properus]MBF9140687.1 hypothetical protein [Hymenobacter properus]MBR7719495.1 hypothetical protein [Microvirga sp. SRT04]